jgi:hypothetical protein
MKKQSKETRSLTDDKSTRLIDKIDKGRGPGFRCAEVDGHGHAAGVRWRQFDTARRAFLQGFYRIQPAFKPELTLTWSTGLLGVACLFLESSLVDSPCGPTMHHRLIFDKNSNCTCTPWELELSSGCMGSCVWAVPSSRDSAWFRENIKDGDDIKNCNGNWQTFEKRGEIETGRQPEEQ